MRANPLLAEGFCFVLGDNEPEVFSLSQATRSRAHSLEYIAYDALDDTSIETLNVNEGTYAWTWAVDHGYIGWTWGEQPGGTMVITGCTHSEENVTIPHMIGGKSMSGIADQAFAGLESMVHVTIPGSIIRIGEEAFAGMGNLETVTVEQGVKEIVLPDGIITIPEHTFEFCDCLEKIHLPESLETIGPDRIQPALRFPQPEVQGGQG